MAGSKTFAQVRWERSCSERLDLLQNAFVNRWSWNNATSIEGLSTRPGVTSLYLELYCTLRYSAPSNVKFLSLYLKDKTRSSKHRNRGDRIIRLETAGFSIQFQDFHLNCLHSPSICICPHLPSLFPQSCGSKRKGNNWTPLWSPS